MLLALLGLHAGLAVAAPLLARRLGRKVLWLTALAPAAALLAVGARAPAVLADRHHVETYPWAPDVGLDVTLRLDGFGLLMVLLVAGIGVLVFAYSTRYFSAREPGLGRFAGLLVGFAGAMLGLVVADNLLVVYVFWELTSITSYLLIGFDEQKASVRAAALQALLVTVTGGLALLAGVVLLGQAAGTYTMSAVLADPPTGPAATAGVLLMLVGALTKSAQVPFHFWLPAAMAAPTPVSAYLHSATLVKAGVYLVARLAPAFAAVPVWRPLVVGFGVATMLVGGWRALRQHDLKLLLAFGTVSQLGFMVALLGAGVPVATLAGGVLLLAHGAFKAALFLVVGIIDHQTHTRDLRRLSGLARRMPGLTVVAGVAAASMAGLPPLLGFVAKEAAFAAFLDGPLGGLGPLALAGIVAGSALTVAYSARFLVGGFGTKQHGRDLVGAEAPRPSAAFVAPAALLAVLTVVLGIRPEPLSPLTNAAGLALDSGVEPETLHLWHGLEPALVLSALAVALGVGLFLARRSVESLQEGLWRWPGMDRAYVASLVGLNHGADLVTGFVQSGSLPRYLAVIMATAVILPTSALIGLDAAPPTLVLGHSPLQLVVVAALTVAALGMVRARRRFAAVLLLGGVGFSVAVLFVLHGAPDLALTQLLVETVSIVVFVLVLRHLPSEFEHPPRRLARAVRTSLAVGVGLFVFAFALVAGSARTQPPVSATYLEQAVPEAGGRNVVNVILVDFRGIDTLGEITVLVTAALGVVGLVRARRQSDADPAEEREAA